MSQQPIRDYNVEALDNNERQYAYDFDHTLRQYMIRTFKPFLMPGKALEMGCYEGEFTAIISEHFEDLTVIEAADSLIAKAKQNVPSSVTFVHSLFEDYNPDHQYDTVFLSHTLEHLDDPIGVLNKVNEWLSPTGRLFLIVPNANAASRQIAVKMGLISHNAAVTPGEAEHGHRCTYSLDTLERDARESGLSIISRGGVFFKPFANFQFDKLVKTDIIDDGYLEGCYQLGMLYPDLCASVYVICEKGT